MSYEIEKRPEFQDFEIALEGSDEVLGRFLESVHAADLAEWMEGVDEEASFRAYRLLPQEDRVELLLFAQEKVRETLMRRHSVDEIVELVELLPADEVVDLLALVDDTTSEHVLRAVDFQRAQGLRELARYDDETAGGLMTTDFVAVPSGAHVGDAIKEIRTEEGPAGEEDLGVFVVDEHMRPVGFVSDRDLLTTGIHTPVNEVMQTDLITVAGDTDQEDVANLVSKYDLDAVPVIDSAGVLVGVVTADDALDVLEEELEEDIRRLVGTSPVEQTHLPVLSRVRSRLPLQVLTVFGGLATAQLLALFMNGEGGGLLRYLPLIIGLAGNVGIQCSTILVRAYATGEMNQDREAAVLRAELMVGLLIGAVCGITTAFVAMGIETGPESMRLAFSVGGAVAIAVTWAAFLGCSVPMICQRVGVDPAIVAGPFLITLSDLSGAAIFIVVARTFLSLGGAGG